MQHLDARLALRLLEGGRPARASARACSSSLARRSLACAAAARTPPTRSPIRRPVRSSAPPAIRKTKTRCAPACENRVEVTQYSASPTTPPRSIIASTPQRSRVVAAAGPEAERAGRKAERQAERDRDRAGPHARGRLDAGRGRRARCRPRSRTAAAGRRLRRPGSGRRPSTRLPHRAAAGPDQEAEQQPAGHEAEADRVDGGLVQLGQPHARNVRAPHALTRP